VNVPKDIERAHEQVVVGSRWFGWGHHWTIGPDRVVDGIREVRMRRDTGPRQNRHQWVAAWRVQRYLTPREDV
jgi:hypothetical protein